MALIFRDTFTEGSDVALESHTPDTGTSWTVLWQTSANVGYTVVASTDIAEQLSQLNEGCIYTADASGYTADHSISCTMTSLSINGDDPIYLLVRIQDQENMYGVRIQDQGGTGTCQLYKKVVGTWTALGSTFNPPADGSVIKLEIIGTALKFYDDGVEVASATDSDISAAGKAGIGGGGGAELITAGDDSSPGNELDTLEVNTELPPITTSTSSTSSSISTSSTSSSISTSSTSSSTSRSTSTSSTSSSISTSSTSKSTSTSSTSSSISTSSTSTSRSTSTSSTSRSTSTSSTSSSTSRSTSTSSTSSSISTSSTSTSASFTTSTSSTSSSVSTSTSTTVSTTTSTSSTSVSTSSTSMSTSTSTTLIAADIYPIPALVPISQTSVPNVADDTIMDDTVVTMDSSTALMGGPTTHIPATRQTVDIIKPRVNLRIRR